MDLTCASNSQIGLLGSSLFIGVVLGCLILPRLADLYGRKPVFLFGLVMIMANTGGLAFCKNMYLAYFILFIGGIGTCGTCFVGFIYSVEIIPKEFQNTAGLINFFFRSLINTLTPVYFWYISNEWVYLAYTAFAFAFISFILTLIIIPDTPRFYYSLGRYDDARKALNVFYRFNIGKRTESNMTSSIVSE